MAKDWLSDEQVETLERRNGNEWCEFTCNTD
jgi:hypothetical protein